MQRLPNLIIAGVHKAATTSLYTYLTAHPDIYGSGRKEIHFFTPLRFGNETIDVKEYEKYFLKWNDEKYAVDASPSYVYGGKTIIDRMQALLPPHKVIVVLRDPVDRFLSNYNYLKAKLLIDQHEDLGTFIKKCKAEMEKPLVDNDYSRALMEGQYMDFIPQWVEAYGSDFKIIYFEELTSDPLKIMFELADWLDIDREPFRAMEFTVENKTIYVKSKAIHSIALFVNHSMEKFFRNNHRFKVFLRNLYYGLNKKNKSAKEEDTVAITYLKSLYADSNSRLMQFLRANHLKTPRWLDQ